jgi:hypothetical protein
MVNILIFRHESQFSKVLQFLQFRLGECYLLLARSKRLFGKVRYITPKLPTI